MTVRSAKRLRDLVQIVGGLSSCIGSLVTGSKRVATWENQTLKKSVSSVMVPTVEREVLMVFFCSMAMDGRTFSASSSSGFSSRSRNCRV